MLLIMSCSTIKKWTASEANINEGLHDIGIINENIAVAYSYGTGNLYKTIDEGKNWEKIYQLDSVYFEQIQFLDEENGWIAGSPNKIYVTRDGGKNWTNKSLPELTECLIYGMWFDTKETGYVAAFEIAVLKTDKKETKIFETHDGGNSWNFIHQIDEVILNLERIDNILYATGYNTIIKNADKENWSYIFRDTTKQTGQIRDIEQNETGKMCASSFNGYIIEIDNNKMEKQQLTQNRIRNLVAANNNEWIAVGDNNKEEGNLFVSKDNGKTWRVDTNRFSDIHRIRASDNKLWVVGKEGLIMTRKK